MEIPTENGVSDVDKLSVADTGTEDQNEEYKCGKCLKYVEDTGYADGFQWEMRKDGNRVCAECLENIVGKFKGVHPILSEWLEGKRYLNVVRKNNFDFAVTKKQDQSK